MELILLERIERLGNVGDEVRVRAGFGRNYLLPQGKAVEATAGNRKLFERRRHIHEARQQDELGRAKAQATAMASLELTARRAASDTEHLYGSVSTHDLADLLSEAGHKVERRQILLDEPIKTLGRHEFRVRLHPDVTADLSVTVEAENE